MVDTTLPALDAGGTVRPRTFRQEDDGSGGQKYTAIGLEHPDQRATLLAALSPLAQLAQLVSLLTAEAGYLDGVEGLLGTIRDKLIALPATAAKQDTLLGITAGTAGLSASGKAPAINQRTTAGVSDVFTPIAGRTMNLVCSGGSGVVAQLERSFDNGATWFVKISDSLRAATPETFTDVETEVGVQYRWNVTAISSGTVTLRISQ